MAIMPDSKVGKIEFCENHVEQWELNAVPMGSSAPAVTAWKTTVTNARAA